MKKLVFALLTLMITCLGLALAPEPAFADEPAAAAAAAPDTAAMEKRIADLEAYVNNGARVDEKESKIMAPGPGHNGFLMVCAALVLFMTAGLAFFSFPIPNLLAPEIDEALPVFTRLAAAVREGRSVGAHCFAGVGRSPLVIASVLALLGVDPPEAWRRVHLARGRDVPDTHLQRAWVSSLVLAAASTRG